MEAGSIIAILILYILVVAEKGVITGFYGAMKATFFLIALSVLTITISPKISTLLGQSEFINSFLDSKALKLVDEKTEEIAAGGDYGYLENILIPDELETGLQNRDFDIVKSESMRLYLKNAVKALFLYEAAVVLTMGASVVILLVLMLIINKIVKTPKPKVSDRVMGFFVGILEGLIGIWIVLSLLHLFEINFEVAAYILQPVRASKLLSAVDDSNLIYLAARYVMGVK